MPGFKMHFSVGAGSGIAYGALGILSGVPVVDGLLAGAMCSVGAILPDLDSASGRPAKEVFGMLGAAIPMLLVNRAGAFGLSHDECFMATIVLFMVIRFGLPSILNRISAHRGMWHSIPAMVLAGSALYLTSQCADPQMRLFRAAGLSVGYLSHLFMDELWSIDVKNGVPRLKKSFGSALKLWSWRYKFATIFTYGLLATSLVFVRQERTQRMANASTIPNSTTPQSIEFGSGETLAAVDWLRSWRGTLQSMIRSDVGSTADQPNLNFERDVEGVAQPTIPANLPPARRRFEPPNLPQFLRSDPRVSPVQETNQQPFPESQELTTVSPFSDSMPESAATGPPRIANTPRFERPRQLPPQTLTPTRNAGNQPFGSPGAPFQLPLLPAAPLETGPMPQSATR